MAEETRAADLSACVILHALASRKNLSRVFWVFQTVPASHLKEGVLKAVKRSVGEQRSFFSS